MNVETGEIRQMTEIEMEELNRLAGKTVWKPANRDLLPTAQPPTYMNRHQRRAAASQARRNK